MTRRKMSDKPSSQLRGQTVRESHLLSTPPLPHAAVHAQILEDLRNMTKAEFRQSMVDAGILYPDGTLTPPYQPEGYDREKAARRMNPKRLRGKRGSAAG